jgi:hypothetical protein
LVVGLALGGPLEAEPEPLVARLSDGGELRVGDQEFLPGVPSPQEFLGYPLGSRFTHHDHIVAYFEALAAASDRMVLEPYGTTYEGRPLLLAVLSTPANLSRLEELRRRHLDLADPARLTATERHDRTSQDPVVVWLAYGVHGNESSSAEAAMAAAYLLAAGREQAPKMLEGALVVIDPLTNPDGRERFVASFEQRRGRVPNPDPDAAEHWEPWPGGRQNHYLIDLNRDWAWMSQRETCARVAAFRRWEPQVYVDFHEMSRRSTYFFPPAADPIHPRIPASVLSWLEVFGRGNAQAFDERGFLFYKEESYDLFYPGYGDSYPSLRGAVGMTYEMAGGAAAGQDVRLGPHRRLTLADRIARHLTASWATVTTAVRHRERLLEDFTRSRLGDGPATTFLWSPEGDEGTSAAELLLDHGVRVERLTRAQGLPARSVADRTAQPAERSFPAGTLAVSTAQPLGHLAAALLEREAALPDSFVDRQRRRMEGGLASEFYDITGWGLPFAFHLEVLETAASPAATEPVTAPLRRGEVAGPGPLGFLLRPRGLAAFKATARLQREGLHYRQALEGLKIGGRSYPAGTLFVPRSGNPPGLDQALERIAAETAVVFEGVATSFSDEGLSLGSEYMLQVEPVRWGLMAGPGISPTAMGALWHLLDQQLELTGARLELETVDDLNLSALDVLILPPGRSYSQYLGDRGTARLKRWVEEGGTLIAVGQTFDWLQEVGLTDFERWRGIDPESGDGNSAVEPEPIETPGAVVATRLRSQHPITAGVATPPPVLVVGSLVIQASEDPSRDVLTARESQPVVAGFAWPEAEARLAGSLLLGVEDRGRGQVVLFAQEPAFRLFWRGTMPLFLNAVLHGPSWRGGD